MIRSFKSALDRQIAVAIRIEMRGSILNRRGEFNRCSLTRLGVDQKWEDERWSKSLKTITNMDKEDDPNFGLVEQWDGKRPGEICEPKGAKKRKMESGERVWGEQVDHLQELRDDFLRSKTEEKPKPRQSTLPVLKGSEWMAYSLVKEMAWEAVGMSICMKDVANWEEWSIECDSVEHEDKRDSMVVMVRPKPECGKAQSVVPTLIKEMGETTTREGGGMKTKVKRNKKNKLPGITASQRSVVEFFNIVNAGGNIPTPIPELKNEKVLEKEYRLARASRKKLQCQKGGEGVAIRNSEMLRGVFTSKLNEGGSEGKSQI